MAEVGIRALKQNASAVVAEAERAGVNLRLVDADTVGVSCDETTTPEHLATVLAAFGVEAAEPGGGYEIPAPLRRTSDFLTHPTFHTHRSETQLMRYLRRLSDRDLALDRTMIPLGSCTMKLNAASEMMPITWPGFAALHPFAPRDQAQGYLVARPMPASRGDAWSRRLSMSATSRCL